MRFISARFRYAVVTLLVLSGTAVPSLAQDAVGVMGGQRVRAADLVRIIDAQPPEVRKQLANDLGALDRLVRSELVRQAILAEARQKQWDKKSDVQLLMERAREQALITSYINELSRAPATYPSEEELRAYYDASQATFTVPAQYELAQIFVAAPDDTDKAATLAAQKKVLDLAAQVQRAPGDFAKIARESSEHKDSAAKGGDLGWVPETHLIPEVRAAVMRMTKGELSPPIRSANGWHIVRLADRKPSATRPLAEVRDTIVANMRLRRAQEMERSYVEGLLGKGALTVNQVELQKLQTAIK